MTAATDTSTWSFPWSAHLIDDPPPDPLIVLDDLPIDEEGTRFDLAQAPWVAGPLEWWRSDAVEWIYLIQGSQTSKTTLMQFLLLYAGKHDPGPAMWIGAVEGEVDKFVVQRLKPFLEIADPSIKTDRKTDWRTQEIRLFGKMLTHFAWATSGIKLRSWPCRYVFGDEVSLWPTSVANIGDPLEYAKKRTRRYQRNRKGVFGTTPTSDLHPSWIAAKLANFARWYVPCPECDHYQFLDFHRIRFDHCKHDGDWNLAEVRESTYYECEACGCKIHDHQKSEIIVRGRLEYVDAETGEPKELDPANKARALHIPATYSTFTTWGELAVMFLEAKAKGSEALRVFVTDELAMPWREKTEAPDADVLTRCIDRDRPAGVVPDETFALTSFVDVQHDRIYYVVRAWGLHLRSWLVQYGMIPRPSDTRLLNFIDEILLTDYQGWPIHRGFVDSGDGADTDVVYAYCRRVGDWRFSPSKGSSNANSEPVKGSVLEKSQGKAVMGGLKLYLLNPWHWKSFVHDHAKVQAGDPGAWRLHAETDANYIRQILSEARVERERGGHIVRDWVLRDRTAGNHLLDCEAGAAAAAWELGVQRLRQPLGGRQMKGARPRPTRDNPETPRDGRAKSAWAITSLSEHLR